MTYYINRSGQQYGPYTETELQNMLAQGQILGTDNAWGEGMAAWAPVSEILSKGSAPQSPHRAATQYEPPPEQPPAVPQYQQQPPYQPQSGYAAPAPPAAGYGVPAYGGGYQQQPAGAVPPSMHWALVLLLGCITGGIFIWVWYFIQAGFVKRIEPRSKATMWFALCLLFGFTAIGAVFYIVFQFHITAEAIRDPEFISQLSRAIALYLEQNVALLIMIYAGALLAGVCALVAFFSMRSSIQRYYNSVEPIGLRLSGVMTFFFNVYYFQYHFSRIARWKETGQLS